MSTLEETDKNTIKIRETPKFKNKLDKKFSAVVFDFDGTLADSFHLILDVFSNEVGKKLPNITKSQIISITQKILEDEIKEKMKNPKKVILRVFYKSCRELGLGRTTSTYISLQSALKVQKQYNKIELFPSAGEALKLLNVEGIPIILITLSSKKKVLEILRKNDLDQYFQIVIDKNDLRDFEKSKGIEIALLAMGIDEDDLQEVIVLGDLPADIKDGKNIGIQTGALLTGPLEPNMLIESNPDYIFSDLDEFISLFKNIED